MTYHLRPVCLCALISGFYLQTSLPAQAPANAGSAEPSAPAKMRVDNGVMLKSWCLPEYTPELRTAGVEGRVTIGFIVDADDSVSGVEVLKSTDPRLNAMALETFKKWSFSHAVENNAAVKTDASIGVVFRLKDETLPYRPSLPQAPNEMPQPRKKTQAKGKVMPMPEYPSELETAGVRGSILFELEVSPEGKAVRPRVMMSTHPAFVKPALDCLLSQWIFAPAMQGRIPVWDKVQVPMEYDFPMTSRKDLLERNGMTGMGGKELRDGNHLPLLLNWSAPVYPYDALVAGKGGKAIVEFLIDGSGTVTEVMPIEASDPLFEGALSACVMNWRFDPVLSDGKGISTTLRAVHEFKPPAPDDKNSPEARLLARLKTPEGIPDARAGVIDEKLRPLYRLAPLNPSKVELSEKIQVIISIIIDREGRARLPQFDASKNVEFCQAAAYAAAQWVFLPPKKDGQPVDVRVKMPFSFER